MKLEIKLCLIGVKLRYSVFASTEKLVIFTNSMPEENKSSFYSSLQSKEKYWFIINKSILTREIYDNQFRSNGGTTFLI